MAITRSTHPATGVPVQVSLLFLAKLDHWAEFQLRRQIRRTYGEMSVAQLRDIGLTPWDVAVALSLPLEKSAADALATAAANEAARW
jgi:uncharacterized protein YjiS (DUF1127 family)